MLSNTYKVLNFRENTEKRGGKNFDRKAALTQSDNEIT